MGERREKTHEEWRVNNRRGDWGEGANLSRPLLALCASFCVSPPLSERLEQARASLAKPGGGGGGGGGSCRVLIERFGLEMCTVLSTYVQKCTQNVYGVKRTYIACWLFVS